MVFWQHPSEGFVCLNVDGLNVDGSMLGSVLTASFGGHIHNNSGAFLKGFYGVASRPSVLYAEIMVVLRGLMLVEWVQEHSLLLQHAVTLIRVGVFHISTILRMKSIAFVNCFVEIGDLLLIIPFRRGTHAQMFWPSWELPQIYLWWLLNHHLLSCLVPSMLMLGE
jgi:hypothetical protein